MSVSEMARMIGLTGSMYLRPNFEATVEVTITDAKTSYGQVRYEVEPVAGSGRIWVSCDTLTIHAH